MPGWRPQHFWLSTFIVEWRVIDPRTWWAGFREGEVTAEAGVAPDCVKSCTAESHWKTRKRPRKRFGFEVFETAHERVTLSNNFMFLGSTYLPVLSLMCHRFIVYLHLVYLQESLISAPPFSVPWVSVPWADIPQSSIHLHRHTV